MVSAPAVAKERGITVSESRQDTSPVYDSLIRITVTTEMGRRSFAGTVVGRRAAHRRGQGHGAGRGRSRRRCSTSTTSTSRASSAPWARCSARPGVNIATFNLGRVAAGEDAIALVGVDQAPDEALLARIKALPHVKEARALTF